MKVRPVENAPFGATVSEFDCASPGATVDELRDLLHRYQLLIFPRQQHLTPPQEVAFCRALDRHGGGVWRDQVNNPWEVYKVEQGNTAGTYQLPDTPEVLVLGKGRIDHHGLVAELGGRRDAYGGERGSQVLGGGGLQWHIDGEFYRHAPCHYTQMRCIEAPAGGGRWLDYADGSGDRLWCEAGATAFASGRIAFERLPAADRETCLQTRVHYASHPFRKHYGLGNSANGLRTVDAAAERRYGKGQDVETGPVDDPLAQVYPLVWFCPVTGLPALMPHPRCLRALETGRRGERRFLGLIESRLRVEKWMRPAIEPARVYVHAWSAGDLAVWDNRSLWHSATGGLAPGDRRVMHLTAFNGNLAPGGAAPAAGKRDRL